MDLVREYADELPVWLICELFGISATERDRLEAFIVGTDRGLTDPATEEYRASVDHGIELINSYVAELVADRRKTPHEDLLTLLVQVTETDPLPFGDEDLIALIVNLIAGAIGSSRAGISNALYLLLTHPEVVQHLKTEPSAIPRAVNEFLRVAPPSRFARRMFLEDVDLPSLTVPKGQYIYLARQAINRDPAEWPQPNTLDIDRPERRHISFGRGPHVCIGQALARLDIQEAVLAFLDHADRAELTIETVDRVPFVLTEQIVSLPICYSN